MSSAVNCFRCSDVDIFLKEYLHGVNGSLFDWFEKETVNNCKTTHDFNIECEE